MALLLLFFIGLPIYLYFSAPVPGPAKIIYVSGGLCVGSVAMAAYGCHVAAGGSARARILCTGAPP